MCCFNKQPAFWDHHAEGSLRYWRGFSLCYWLLTILALTRFCLVITTGFGYTDVFGVPYEQAHDPQFQGDQKLVTDSKAYLLSREKEWQRRPFINLWLQDSPCADPTFNRTWEGTRAYKTDTGYAVETPIVKISQLDNLNLCMTQSAQTYKDTQKADSDTGLCSGNLQSCSSFTSFESTICVDDKNLCPITDVRLVKKGDEADNFIA